MWNSLESSSWPWKEMTYIVAQDLDSSTGNSFVLSDEFRKRRIGGQIQSLRKVDSCTLIPGSIRLGKRLQLYGRATCPHIQTCMSSPTHKCPLLTQNLEEKNNNYLLSFPRLFYCVSFQRNSRLTSSKFLSPILSKECHDEIYI